MAQAEYSVSVTVEGVPVVLLTAKLYHLQPWHMEALATSPMADVHAKREEKKHQPNLTPIPLLTLA